MTDLTGRKIIITGGTSGMGESMVRTFPKLGADVVFWGRNEAVGHQLEEEMGAHFIKTDVTDKAQVYASVEKSVEILGGVDVFIHAAGVAPGGGPAEETTDEIWELAMRSNADSTYYTNVAIFPYMKEKGGHIINFTSAGGISGYPNKAAYAASKGAVTTWSRTVASEWAKYNIRVNMIEPTIWTPMYDKTRANMTPEQLVAHDAMMKRAIPLGGKLGDAYTDFVPIMAFLASEDAHYLTGQVFCIDGGTLMMR